jgi:hypothetical protein
MDVSAPPKEKEKMMSLGNTLGFKNLSKFYFLVIIFFHYSFHCFKILLDGQHQQIRQKRTRDDHDPEE